MKVEDIVGYQNKDLRSGFKMVGSSFAGMGAEKTIDLTQLTVKGYDSEEGDEGTVNVQFLTAGGRTEAGYMWLDMPGDFDPGWYNDDFEAIEVGSVTIKAGDGLWVYGDEGFTLDFAGEVVTKGAVLPLREGFKALCNPIAKDIDLTECWVTGYDAEEGDEGTVNVQFLTAGGRTEAGYMWLDMPGDFDAGWYNDDFEAIEEGMVTIRSGDGLWVYGADGFALNFPAL